MKLCFKCHREKPLEEFYRHPMMGDGRLGKCKDCTRADVRANRLARVDYYRKYDVERHANDPKRRESDHAHSKRFRAANPHMTMAHTRVSNALRSGRLVKQPCRDCQRTDVHGHHADYARPLDVVWLCPVHHRAEHAKGAGTRTALLLAALWLLAAAWIGARHWDALVVETSAEMVDSE
jgi:hypothetical protein